LFRLCDMSVLLPRQDGRWNGPSRRVVLTIGAAFAAGLLAFRRRCP
jgi:hypothetical protein